MNKIELQIPPEIYERARRIADETHRSIEAVFLDSISLLFGNLSNVTSDQLQYFTDEQLWAVVHQRPVLSEEIRLRELMSSGKRGELSEEQKAEMVRLIEGVDQYMLLRSQALLLLKQRGHDVDSHLKT